MCEFCIRHGEGKKWYLHVENYSEDLWSDIKRKKVAKKHFELIAGLPNKEFKIYKFFHQKFPFLGLLMLRRFKNEFKKKHLGQAVPIEDVRNILHIVNSVVRIPCVCRNSTKGKNARYCFAISIDPKSIGMAEFVDDNYFKGPDVRSFEKFDKKDALEFMLGLEKLGILHTVWTVQTPFVAFICNCGYDGCIPMMSYKEITPIIMKAEYIARVDGKLCTRCRACIKHCPFNAMKLNESVKIVEVDVNRCYGCGICRSVCKENAIKLFDRKDNIVAANLWY